MPADFTAHPWTHALGRRGRDSGRHIDRVLVVMSDIEMGAGGNLDDFPHTEWLAQGILAYNEAPYSGLPVDLVLNGDTFDFLKTSFAGEYPHHITEAVALGKLDRVVEAHPAFFEGLRRFLDHPAPRRVWFVVGNHDAELVFPGVQRRIRELLGQAQGLRFPGFHMHIGDVHIEHGHQLDPMFRVDPDRPFLRYEDKPILDLPWATVGLLDVALPLQPVLFAHDRLRPRKLVFELMPELRELVLNRYWQYWTRDYWRGFFDRSDPVKKMSWTMFREIAYRFVSADPDLEVLHPFEEEMRRTVRFRVYVLGHLHAPCLQTYSDRRLIRTGCMRDEFSLDRSGGVSPLPKTYAELFLSEGRTVRSRLVDVDGPPSPPGHVPESVFDVLAAVRELIGTQEERSDAALAQQRQIAREEAS